MPTLCDLVPDVEVLLALEPEMLAGSLLQLVPSITQNGRFHPDSMQIPFEGNPHLATNALRYPQQQRGSMEGAVAEAWHWLKANSLVIPERGQNGLNGWCVLTRRGQQVINAGSIDEFRRAVSFPKVLLHESIRDDVWLALVTNDLDTAVFKAFRQVEIAVRNAGAYTATDLGVPLMRRAFHPDDGPLTKMTDPASEREALASLFAGAIGSYKNPHSHRNVALTEETEAYEMVLLASHLLRIVDSRSP
jgi:uncharacterized protein (TIGR02391 family)